MYSERIVEEMRALRAGMEELKMASSKRLDEIETGMKGIAGEVEHLHDRADELEGGYESYSDSEGDTDSYGGFRGCDSDSESGSFGVLPPPVADSWTVADNWTADAWSFYESPGRPLLCGRRVRILWRAGEARTQEKGNTQSSGKTQWWAGYVCAYNCTAGLHKV